MFDFRLKRAQVALSDGRLDEAFELLKDSSIAEHHSGQKLLTRLSTAFARRGREHLEATLLAPALEDCLKAEKLAGNQPEVEQLRSEICRQIESERLESQQRAEQLARAKEQMQNGWLSTGRKILAETDDQQAQCLMLKAETIELEKDSAVNRIQDALKSGQIEYAAQIYQKSPLYNSMDSKAVGILNQIQIQAGQKLKEYLVEGQVHLASVFLSQLNGKISQSDLIQQYRQVIDFSHQVAQQIESGDFESVVLNLRKIQRILIKAKWVSELLQQAQNVVAAKQELQAGPLGILEKRAFSKIPDIISTPRKMERDIPESIQVGLEHHLNGMAMKIRFILQIDGVGAYYVFGDSCVTIGPVSSSVHSDIELVTAPDVRPKQIQRVEGDYFFGEMNHTHSVNHSAKQLLSDGDRVELSKRCRFKFAVPNPASSTACLIPSSARFPRADISGVILMAREILIGPERNCHIQTGHIPEAMTLFLQDDHVRCRTNQTIFVEGNPLTSGNVLPMNKQIEIGDIQFNMITHKS